MFVNSIYSAESGLVIGFHGCEKSTRDKIVNGSVMMKPSQNCYDWLGGGFYFWQNNYERAMDFAMNPPGVRKFNEPAVLGAVLSLGNCLDISDKKSIDQVQYSHHILRDIFEAERRILPQNRNIQNSNDKVLRELDCAVIENLHKVMHQSSKPPFDSLRGIFIEGKPIYDGAGFYERTHVQICIRNPNCIKGFFIPRKEIKWRTVA